MPFVTKSATFTWEERPEPVEDEAPATGYLELNIKCGNYPEGYRVLVPDNSTNFQMASNVQSIYDNQGGPPTE